MSRLIPAALEQRYETASTRVSETLSLSVADDASRIAKCRALITAYAEMDAVYAEARRTSADSGLLWSALFDAQSYTRRLGAAIEHELKTLGGEL